MMTTDSTADWTVPNIVGQCNRASPVPPSVHAPGLRGRARPALTSAGSRRGCTLMAQRRISVAQSSQNGAMCAL